jgi:uncharacterized protein (DUF1810 family)
MPDPQRFLDAQENVYSHVCAELQGGMKRSHWMWFIFPQLAGLGSSPTAQHFAISSLDEAKAFLQHPVLGPRLIECTELVNRISGRSIHDIFGYPDDLKFHSSMTLFSRAASGSTVFRQALQKYFQGRDDDRTLELLGLKE